jgi:hypothetical protein
MEVNKTSERLAGKIGTIILVAIAVWWAQLIIPLLVVRSIDRFQYYWWVSFLSLLFFSAITLAWATWWPSASRFQKYVHVLDLIILYGMSSFLIILWTRAPVHSGVEFIALSLLIPAVLATIDKYVGMRKT